MLPFKNDQAMPRQVPVLTNNQLSNSLLSQRLLQSLTP